MKWIKQSLASEHSQGANTNKKQQIIIIRNRGQINDDSELPWQRDFLDWKTLSSWIFQALCESLWAWKAPYINLIDWKPFCLVRFLSFCCLSHVYLFICFYLFPLPFLYLRFIKINAKRKRTKNTSKNTEMRTKKKLSSKNRFEINLEGKKMMTKGSSND